MQQTPGHNSPQSAMVRTLSWVHWYNTQRLHESLEDPRQFREISQAAARKAEAHVGEAVATLRTAQDFEREASGGP